MGWRIVVECDMKRDCTNPITHIDEKGFIYCKEHGIGRRRSGIYCRQLRPWELKLIHAGKPVPSYERKPKPKPEPTV